MDTVIETIRPEGEHCRWNTVFILSAVQALSQSGSAIVMTVTALTGVYVAERPALATVPLALQFIASTLAAVPVSFTMGRLGRRLGFSVGQFFGLMAALVAAYGIFLSHFWLFALGSAGIGVHNTFWQQVRFAAAEVASTRYRARSIAYVSAGGIVAAVAGPWLAVQTRDLFSPVLFVGCYVAVAVLAAITIVVIQFAEFESVPEPETPSVSRPLGAILRDPAFLLATLSASLGYGAMSLVMTATPLAIMACGYGFGHAASVIQWHVLAMFVPGFFTGNLINRYGALRIILAGVGMNVVAMIANTTGSTYAHFWTGLVAIGLGWNFMFIGGTSMLTEFCRPCERTKVQALNDVMVFGSIAAASLLSGALYSLLGWTTVNLALVLPITLVIGAAWLYSFQRAGTPA